MGCLAASWALGLAELPLVPGVVVTLVLDAAAAEVVGGQNRGGSRSHDGSIGTRVRDCGTKLGNGAKGKQLSSDRVGC